MVPEAQMPPRHTQPLLLAGMGASGRVIMKATRKEERECSRAEDPAQGRIDKHREFLGQVPCASVSLLWSTVVSTL